MKTRALGTGGLRVSAIGLGCMVMPGFYKAGNEAESIATIHRAREIGATHLDTSDIYGAGKNEELVGRAIKGMRDDFVLATKFGNVRAADGTPGVIGRPEYVAEACEASLKRLGVEVIDLYYQHRIDPKVPVEETIGAMSRLVEQGKVRFLGISEAAPDTLRRAHATHPIAALQSEYSLWSRDDEADLIPLCAELGIGYVAYSPLGRGIFTGDITGGASLEESDRRRAHPRFQGENLQRNLALIQPVLDLAAAKGVPASTIALAWVLAHGEHIVAIPGTRKATHLEDNAAAAAIELTADEIAALDAALAPGTVSGDRYPAGGMKWLRL